MEHSISSVKTKCTELPPLPFGVDKIQLCELSWIETWPEFISEHNKYGQDIVLKAGKSFVDVDLILDSTFYKSSFSISKNSFTTQVEGLVAYGGPSNKNKINLINKKELIILVTLKNEEKIILGSPEYPCSININTDIGKQAGDFIGHPLSVQWISSHQPYYSSDTIVQADPFACPQILELVFEYNTGDDIISKIISASAVGTINVINATGLTNVIINIDASPVSVPFNTALGNVLEIAFDPAPSDGELKMIGTY